MAVTFVEETLIGCNVGTGEIFFLAGVLIPHFMYPLFIQIANSDKNDIALHVDN